MTYKIKFFDVEGEVEGHSAGREVEVEQMTLKTAGGDEITLEPEGENGERWRVAGGPDDLEGHSFKIGR